MVDTARDTLVEGRAARLASKAAKAGKPAKAKAKPAPKKARAKVAPEAITPATPPKAKPTPEEAKANRAKALEAARAAKAAQKAEKEAEAAKKAKEADKVLAPLARDINARLESANKNQGKVDDMRLSAAVLMKEAEEKALAAGISFKKWASEHITQMSWENARKLLTVGKAPNPRLALADMRLKNAEANKALRKKRTTPKAQQLPAPPKEQARQAFERMADTERAELIRQEAEKMGLPLRSAKHELEVIERAEAKNVPATAPQPASLVTLKQDFASLRMVERMSFVKWAAAELGLEVASPAEFAVAAE